MPTAPKTLVNFKRNTRGAVKPFNAPSKTRHLHQEEHIIRGSCFQPPLLSPAQAPDLDIRIASDELEPVRSSRNSLLTVGQSDNTSPSVMMNNNYVMPKLEPVIVSSQHDRQSESNSQAALESWFTTGMEAGSSNGGAPLANTVPHSLMNNFEEWISCSTSQNVLEAAATASATLEMADGGFMSTPASGKPRRKRAAVLGLDKPETQQKRSLAFVPHVAENESIKKIQKLKQEVIQQATEPQPGELISVSSIQKKIKKQVKQTVSSQLPGKHKNRQVEVISVKSLSAGVCKACNLFGHTPGSKVCSMYYVEAHNLAEAMNNIAHRSRTDSGYSETCRQT